MILKMRMPDRPDVCGEVSSRSSRTSSTKPGQRFSRRGDLRLTELPDEALSTRAGRTTGVSCRTASRLIPLVNRE